MHRLLVELADVLFPPRTEELLVRTLTEELVLGLYKPKLVSSMTALTEFQHPIIRALVHEAKYEGNRRAQELLSKLIGAHVKRHPELARAVWVPVPLSPARLRERGYNQVLEVLAQTALSAVPQVLERTRDTKPQTTLPRNERFANMEGAFSSPAPERVTGAHIVLLDDVVTTGATLAAARDALLPYVPASITMIALAH